MTIFRDDFRDDFRNFFVFEYFSSGFRAQDVESHSKTFYVDVFSGKNDSGKSYSKFYRGSA